MNYQKIEKALALFSLGTLILAVVSWVVSALYDIKILDTVAVYGLTAFVIPFMLLQVVMTANIHTYGIRTMGKLSLLFYLLIFPLVDIWFFTGVNVLYHFIPNYHHVERALRAQAQDDYVRQAWAYAGAIYGSLVMIGILIRFLKKPTRMIFA